MLSICWNVRTNNDANFEPRYDPMINAIVGQYGAYMMSGAPWVLAVLENKSGGEAIARNLMPRLRGSWMQVVALGGGPSTREFIILVGGGCTLNNGEVFDDWQPAFTRSLETSHADAIARVRERQEANTRSMRPGTLASTLASVSEVEHWDADNCRNPCLIEVRSNAGGTYQLGYVHAPGPSANVMHLQRVPYAEEYFKAVFATVRDRNLDCLMGDFNLYGAEPLTPATYGLFPIGQNLGGTTFDGAGGVGSSRLDRVYVAADHIGHSSVSLLNGGPVVSDHLGVAVCLTTLKQNLAQSQNGKLSFSNAPAPSAGAGAGIGAGAGASADVDMG